MVDLIKIFPIMVGLVLISLVIFGFLNINTVIDNSFDLIFCNDFSFTCGESGFDGWMSAYGSLPNDHVSLNDEGANLTLFDKENDGNGVNDLSTVDFNGFT